MEPDRIWMILEKILVDDQGQYEDFLKQKIVESDPFLKNLWKECFRIYQAINTFDSKTDNILDIIGSKIENILREAPIEQQKIWAFVFYLKSLYLTLQHDYKPAFASIKSSLSFFSDDDKQSLLYPLYRLQLAQIYWNLDEFDAALAEATEIKQLSVEMHYTFGISHSFQFFAYNNWRMGKYSEALENQIFLVDLWKSLEYKKIVVKSLNFQGMILQLLGRSEEAIKIYNSGLHICNEISDIQNKALIYLNLSVTYRLLGNYSSAEDFAEKSVSLCKRITDYKTLGKSLLCLGLIQELMGNFTQAQEHYKDAFEIFDTKSFLLEKSLASVRISLLEVKSLGNLENAFIQLKEAIQLLEKTKDERNSVFYYFNLVDIFLENNDTQEAKRYLLKIIRSRSNIQSPYDKMLLYIAETRVDIKTNNLGNALDKITIIQGINNELKFYEEQLQTELLLAEIYLRKYQIKYKEEFLQSAYIHIEKSIELAGRKRLNKYIVKAYSLKASMLTAEGDLEGSLDYIQATLEVAKNIGLNSLIKNTQELHEKVKMQKLAYSRVKLLENEKKQMKQSFKMQNLILATESLDLLQQKQKQYNIDFKKIGLVIYKNASGKGPYTHFIEKDLLLSFDNLIEKINQIGTTYFIILGGGSQGGSYHQGLFGPLPFLQETKQLALIFAVTLSDSSQEDPRFGNKSYVYFCYVFPTEYSYLLPQEKIKKIIEKTSLEIKDFSKLSDQFFDKLGEDIKKIF